MTIKSMTGFGRAERDNGQRTWNAEIRTVNNRFLDLKLKLPHGYAPLEEKIRRKVSGVIQRGRVDLFLSVSGDFSDLQEVRVNSALARGYRQALQEIAGTSQVNDELMTRLIVSFPEVIIREQRDEDLSTVWSFVEQLVDEALADCDRMRQQEGEALAADLTTRLELFSKTVDHIAVQIPEILQQRRSQLEERLEKLLGNISLDPVRLAQEVAVIADKVDVTEEIVRLRSHIDQLAHFLQQHGGVGRKIDFLIQEFLREVNTLASKINDSEIALYTVELKSELEKMREQVQNIE